jgi:hypothetical protein
MSDSDKETWSNNGQGDVFVLTFDHTGKLRSVPIRSGQKLTMTIEERQLNQERAFAKDVDIFHNGRLTPVRLVDTAEDYEEIASNPNHLSEDDMKEILKLKGKTFSSRLETITNVIALERMVDLAGDDSLGVSMAQFKTLDKRLNDVRGTADVDVISEVETVTP